MKTILRITILSLLFFALGCSKEDNEVPLVTEAKEEPETPVIENSAPLTFELISPTENGANADISVTPTLSWNASTDPDGDFVQYDLYLDTATIADQLYAENLAETTFEVTERLGLLQNYVWRVVAKDPQGAMTSSTTSNFSTRDIQFNETPVTNDAGFPARSGHSTVVFDNKLWVIGGLGNLGFLIDVWFSSDGITWSNATSTPAFMGRFGHTSGVFDNKIWVIGGHNSDFKPQNDVWFSEDGVNWEEATGAASFPARSGHSTVVFDNKIWVIGGASNVGSYSDVWYSEDGINWTEATSTATFANRFSHSSEVFDNKLWVIGGKKNNQISQNDVWYSEDGVTWQEATGEASFPARFGHSTVVFDNKLWVIGGKDDTRINDVWFSADGSVWEETASAIPFTERTGNTSSVFDNKVWIIGGNDNEAKNDIWTFD